MPNASRALSRMVSAASSSGLGDARVGRAHFHPGFQCGDFFRRQFFALGRHLEIFIRVTHRLDQKTFVRIARFDGRAGVAAFQQRFAGIEQQAAFDFFAVLAVALVAVVGEDGADLAFKKLGAGGIDRRSRHFGQSQQVSASQQIRRTKSPQCQFNSQFLEY